MKRFKMLLVFVTALYSLLPALLFAQVDTAWVRRYNGPGNVRDEAYSIKVDAQGNVYVTGCSPSTSSSGSEDYATIKYNTAGTQQWLRRYNGPGNSYDRATSLAIDVYSNVYVTGYSRSTSTPGSEDYATHKYNASGTWQWTSRYNGPGNGLDEAYSLAVYGTGNVPVYVTGSSYGSGTNTDYATIKYNSTGDTFWVRRYNGPGNSGDDAKSLAVDGSGNVYVTGESQGSGTYYDYATIKYSAAGTQQWIQRYNGPGNDYDGNTSLVVDASGNVYVTGASAGSGTDEDYATIKYNSAGVQQWVARYNGPTNSRDRAYALAVDGSGNVYVTGESYGGSGTYYDYATVKYNSAGVEQWVRRYDGPENDWDCANALAIDGHGNVYVTGFSYGSNNADCATIKYNSAGVQQWIARYNGTANNRDCANALAIDVSGNVYVTGSVGESYENYDYLTIKYVQAGAIEENENCKLKSDNFSVFPNPASSFFVVRGPLTANKVTIFDVTGKVITEVKLRMGSLTSLSQRISLDGIKNGIYFVKVGNEMIREKLVITK